MTMRVAIIGGGTIGLTLGYRLASEGCKVTVFEAGPQLGGLATWFNYGDFTWDKFYHVICRSDSVLLSLFDELGISSQVNWSETKTGFLWNNRHISMSNHWEFLTFPALSLFDKMRLAAGLLYCQRINDPTELEKIKASVWLTNVFGKRVYQTIWEPLLESKFGRLKNRIPATIMWATIRRYSSTRSKKGGQECLGFLTGSLKTFYDALSKAIESRGGSIFTSAKVNNILELYSSGVVINTDDGNHEFDKVISTVPTAILQNIAPDIPGLFESQVDRPEFIGVVCLSLVLKRSLNPYYITNLIQRGFPFTGIIEVSNLTGTEHLNGNYLVMLPRYDVPQSDLFNESDEEIATSFITSLRHVWPDIAENIMRYYVQREKRVQAIWISNPPPANPTPSISQSGNIWNINAELSGRDTLNNNASVRIANWGAKEFMRSMYDYSSDNINIVTSNLLEDQLYCESK